MQFELLVLAARMMEKTTEHERDRFDAEIGRDLEWVRHSYWS